MFFMTNRTLKQELVVINQNVIFKTSFIIRLLIALVTFVSYSLMLTRFVLFHGCFGRSLELTLVAFKTLQVHVGLLYVTLQIICS